jgi:hypothetical protein
LGEWDGTRANESFAYTEIDRTAQIGSDYRGRQWRRAQDKVGAAFVVNGISGDHRGYLAVGGLGFILGDGALNYGLEKVFETYYTAHVLRGVSVALDYQYVTNPAITGTEARLPSSASVSTSKMLSRLTNWQRELIRLWGFPDCIPGEALGILSRILTQFG